MTVLFLISKMRLSKWGAQNHKIVEKFNTSQQIANIVFLLLDHWLSERAS